MEEFFELIQEGHGVVGLPSGVSLQDLPDFLEGLEVEIFPGQGQAILSLYWRDGVTGVGGCISVL